MSVENVKSFIEALSGDSQLLDTLRAARDPEEVGRLLVGLSAERGLPFTAEEFLSVVAPQGAGAVPIGDDQLAGVVGGSTLSPSEKAKLGGVLAAVGQMFSSPGTNLLNSLTPSQSSSLNGKPPA
jgi:hypothetical protein